MTDTLQDLWASIRESIRVIALCLAVFVVARVAGVLFLVRVGLPYLLRIAVTAFWLWALWFLFQAATDAYRPFMPAAVAFYAGFVLTLPGLAAALFGLCTRHSRLWSILLLAGLGALALGIMIRAGFAPLGLGSPFAILAVIPILLVAGSFYIAVRIKARASA